MFINVALVYGIYAVDLAETKAMQVMNYARKYEHPLQAQLEKIKMLSKSLEETLRYNDKQAFH